MKIITLKPYLFLIATVMLSSYVFSYDQKFATYVLSSHLNTLATLAESQSATNIQFSIKNIFTGRKISTAEMDARLKILYATQALPPRSHALDKMIDEHFLDKMGIVAGEGKKINHHLLQAVSSIDDKSLIVTSFGHANLLRLISEPTPDIKILEKRQTIIKVLVENESLLKEAMITLEKFKETENDFLEFFTHNKKTFNHLYWELPFLSNNWYSQEIGARYSQFYRCFGVFGSLKFLSDKYSSLFTSFKNNDISYRNWQKKNTLEKLYDAGQHSWNSAYWAFSSIMVFLDFQKRNNEISYLQKKLINITDLIKQNERLAFLLYKIDGPKNLKHLSLYDNRMHYSSEFNELIKFLLTNNTFTGNESQFSYIGKVFLAHKTLEKPEIYTQFKTLLNALGELEAYVTIARKMKASQNKVAHYCFVEFLEHSSSHIEGINTWNPCVAQEKAVNNDLIMSKETGQNYIMTGPNKGGKSTFMKSIMFNVILAHTFGIASADTFAITPFHLLLSHLNENDSLVDETSRFQAQCNRANYIFQAISSLKPGQRCFTLLDEIFSGTSHDQEIELTLEFIKELAKLSQCCFMVATHLPSLTKLADLNIGCINMHMEVLTNALGRVIKYTYKLKHGISIVKNADQVAQDAGLMWLKKINII